MKTSVTFKEHTQNFALNGVRHVEATFYFTPLKTTRTNPGHQRTMHFQQIFVFNYRLRTVFLPPSMPTSLSLSLTSLCTQSLLHSLASEKPKKNVVYKHENQFYKLIIGYCEPISLTVPSEKFHVISHVKNLWNWNNFTCQFFITHKCGKTEFHNSLTQM